MAKLLKHLGGSVADREGDLAYVFSICDRDKDGAISKAELLPAIATWKMLLEKMPATTSSSSSSACLLL